jgi:hypothetical protein
MKVLTILICMLFLSLPAGAKEIFIAVEDSQTRGKTVVFVDRWGRLREQQVTTYSYLMEDGSKVTLPYKLPHLRDDRHWTKKHPYLCLLGTALLGSSSTIVNDLR